MISLWEAISTDHYLERKEERGTIVDISIRIPQAYKGHDVEETNKKLIPILQAELDKRFKFIETEPIGKSGEFNVGAIFFLPYLKNGKVLAPITMTCNSGDRGLSYLAIVMSDKLVTVYPELYYKKEDVENSITAHLIKEGKENGKLPLAIRTRNALFEIDIDEVYGAKKQEKEPELIQPKVSEESLDYEVRTDYRVGANFNHDKYGEGKVVAAASGGKAGVNGVVDWIDVKYPKPFLKGGKLQDTRRFTDVLTKAYFGKTKKQ